MATGNGRLYADAMQVLVEETEMQEEEEDNSRANIGDRSCDGMREVRWAENEGGAEPYFCGRCGEPLHRRNGALVNVAGIVDSVGSVLIIHKGCMYPDDKLA